MFSDVPCRSEGEREVSEGHGLGDERLRGRLTEEREESGGTGQIPMDDGPPVLGRATGNVGSGRWRSTPVAGAKEGVESGVEHSAVGTKAGRGSEREEDPARARGREEEEGWGPARSCHVEEEGVGGGGRRRRWSVGCLSREAGEWCSVGGPRMRMWAGRGRRELGRA
jgi:hypothetical protein